MALRITKRRDNFKQRIAEAPKKARRLEEKHTRAWVSVLHQIMPRLTGAMIESTEAVPVGERGWGVRIAVSYWRMVNDGTIYQEGQHFVEEAREFVRRGFLRDLKNFSRA